MSNKKQVVVMSWTDKEILTLDVFDYDTQEDESWELHRKLSEIEHPDPSYDFRSMTKEHFFDTFIKPQIKNN